MARLLLCLMIGASILASTALAQDDSVVQNEQIAAPLDISTDDALASATARKSNNGHACWLIHLPFSQHAGHALAKNSREHGLGGARPLDSRR